MRPMTVGQLIQALSIMPTDDLVVMDTDPAYTHVTDVAILNPAARVVVIR